MMLVTTLFACSNPKENTKNNSIQSGSDSITISKGVGTDTPYISTFDRISMDSLDRSKKVQQLKNSEETRLLHDLDTLIMIRVDRFFIRLYTREAGAVEIPETHGIYYNVLISVSEYGEYEPNRVFSVGPFIGPEFKTKGTDLKDRYVIDVNHGFRNEKHTRLTIYLDKVIAEEIP